MSDTSALIELIGMREVLQQVLDDLELEHPAAARRRIVEALGASTPPLPIELGAARAIVRAARSLVVCTGPELPDAPPATDTAYRTLYATMSAADRAVRLIEAGQ